MTFKSIPYTFNKVSNGTNGKGIKTTSITYQVGTSGVTAPTGTWQSSIPSVGASQFLWTRIVITYTDNATSTVYTVGMMGAKGDKGDTGSTGTGIKSVTNYYLASASSSGVTTSTSGWTTTVQTITATNKYLWNYEVITYTDNKTTTTTPCIIGAYGNTGNTGGTGATGNGISGITEYYQVSTSNTTAPTTWVTTVPTMTATNKYMWNYEVIAYTNGTSKETSKRVIGVYGDTGNTGATGSTGATGTGIESITTEYYLSTSKTAQSGGSWSTTMPSWSYGKYLWIRSKVVYKNPTSTAYTVAYCDSSWEAVKNVENDILAWCYNNDKTYINGSKIYARSITSNQLATDSIKSTNYVANSVGSFLNLADGSFDSKYLKWTKEGVITATSGYIAGIKIDATKLTASATSGSITSGYQITNNGEISAYSNGSGINSSLYLTGDKVQLISMTTAGSLQKELTISTTGLTLQSEGTQVGYITASGDGMNIFGNRGIYAKSNFYADNVPTAGAFEDNGTNFGFGDLKGYPCFIGSVYQSSDKTWYNAISVRHRNNLGDGNQYGMFIRSVMTSTTSKLVWNQQHAGNWGTDRTIIDSSGGIINGKVEILEGSSASLYVRGGISTGNIYFNTNVYSSINGRPNGGFDFWFNSNGMRIVFEAGKIYRVSADDVWTVIAG